MDLSTLMPEQRRVVTTLDKPLFVSAGAGSGKTFTLTKRIVWALSPESGPFVRGMDEVLAITFTNKAASELKERVRRALMEEGMADAALGVDAAWISTIHGMCSRILKTYALELGLDPSFEVLGYADELKVEALDRVLAGFGDPRSAYPHLRASYRLVAGAGGFSGASDVSSMAQKLLDAAMSCTGEFDAVSWVRARVDTADLADAYRMLLADRPSAATRQICEAAFIAIDTFEASEKGEHDVAALVEGCGKPRASKANAHVMPYFKAVRADVLLSACFACNEPARAELADLARKLFEQYEGLKRERGGLDNDDLLRLAYRALADHPAVRADFAGRFKMVMVDEFQDTSAQQVELIGLLCSPDKRELATVGDAQQSIYRFRGADVSVFRRQEEAVRAGAGSGSLVQLTRNFRSHADVLEYVRRVFGGEQGLMRGFLDLEPSPARKDGFACKDGRRRQAVLVAGGTAASRAQAKARAVARRFREYRDLGQPVGDMVLLLGSMTFAGVYADAIRAEGMACVIAGGSVFSSAIEVRTIAALLRFLANPSDSKRGLLPVLTSSMFALGADELLALATTAGEDGSVRRANIDASLLASRPGDYAGLPLAERAAEVLRAAAAQVGRKRVSDIAREAVAASGWLDRLEREGAEGRACAANVLKALDLASSLEDGAPGSARALSDAFERHLELSKEAPGALTASGEGAVRIMTVHASKGLEFPVVAVADCYRARGEADKLVTQPLGSSVRACLAPSTFDAALSKKMAALKKDWKDALAAGADTGGSDSAWSAYDGMLAENLALDLEERARLLYVAMTRAKEALVLVLDAACPPRSSKLSFKPESDLTLDVLERILPAGEALDADRLAFEDSVAGDYELVALADVEYEGILYPASVEEEDDGSCQGEGSMQEFVLVREEAPEARVVPAVRVPRDSYSYSSLARERHACDEDRAPSGGAGEGECEGLPDGPIEIPSAGRAEAASGDPTALGSAFHAAAQLMVETGRPVACETVDALCRYWGVAEGQRKRLEAALARWESSSARAELASWPVLRAEVPFFAPGAEGLGAFAEGAIDLLATDPARPGEALVVDYKTGGSPAETPEQLQAKHELQASVYADVLHKAGYEHVTLRFVRVEQEDPDRPGEPQVVEYRM